MNKGLLRLLSGFSENDWTMFEKFLDSPFFVNARNYKKLFAVIRNNRNNFSILTPDYINKHLGEKLNSTTLNTRFSELYKHAIKFLYHVDAEKNMPVYYNALLKSMAERKLYKNAISLYSQVKDAFMPNTIYDYNEYLKHLLTIGGISREANDLDGFYEYFKQYINYSSVFALYSIVASTYSSVSLDHKAMVENREKFLKLFKLVNYEEIKNHFGNDPLFKPIIQVYYILNAYLNDNDESNYKKAFKYFGENFGYYSDLWKEELYLNLQSICVHRVQKGDAKYYFHYFNIIKHKINNNQPIITEYSHYGVSEFHDIVNVAIACREYEWAELFVNEFSSKLNQEIREMEINRALTALYISRKDYLKAYEIVSKYQRTANKFYNTEIYIYKAIVCYELDKDEEMEKTLNNIIKIANKYSKSSPIYFDLVKIFAVNAGKLRKLTHKPKKKVHDFIFTIKNQNVLFPQKNWLLEKAEELL